MKKIALMTYESNAGVQYLRQLEDFFEGRVEIESYCVIHNDMTEEICADLFVLSFADILEYVERYIPERANIVYMSRTFLKSRIQQLDAVQSEKCLLLDYSDILATETIGVIREIGYTSIEFEVIGDLSELEKRTGDSVILIGEKDDLGLAADTNKIFALGYYMISLTTLADIAQRLDLMDEVMNRKLYHYSKIVAITDSGIVDTLRHAWNIRQEFEMILEFIEEGALVYNEDGIILHINTLFEDLIHRYKDGTTIRSLPAALEGMLSTEEEFTNQILKLREDTILMISKYRVNTYNDHPAYLVIAKNISSIQQMDHKIRVEQAKSNFKAKYTFDQILTYDPAMIACIDIAKKLAKTDISLLITGENGTGKEMFAQSIHNASHRRNMPFVAINCAALPHDLLESELFGYEEGAFTGARKGGKRGIFELGHGGTVFLDEIGDMPASTQVKLLRVLQEREVMRLGSEALIRVDTRIIAATNVDIEKLIRSNKFRQDLYYRLNVAQICIPPLRERKEDIIPLLNHFLRKYSKEYHSCSEGLKTVLKQMNWDGNVRELENLVQYLITVGEEELRISDLPIKYKSGEFKGALPEELADNYEKLIEHLALDRKLGRRRIKKELEKKGIYLSEYRIRLCLDNILGKSKSN